MKSLSEHEEWKEDQKLKKNRKRKSAPPIKRRTSSGSPRAAGEEGFDVNFGW